MVKTKIPCKVIIVGGGVAGLSLANMLERVGIDFLVLEAYENIAPQVGASIAIYPHFARILDQIGCWDSLRNLLTETVNHGFYHNQNGESIFDFRGLADELEMRHGYPVIFLERQMLLKALYNNLAQKGKVLVRNRFVNVQIWENGVRVFTENGSSYEGDIVIGADGIHSSVRKAMHQLGRKFSSKYFDRDEYAKVPCTYKCIFGMSRPTRGIKQGTNHIVLGHGHSYLILTGPGNKVYWFLNVKNTHVTYGKGVPRYSAEDEQRLAKEHFGDRLNDFDKFEDVYRNKIISTLTPLHEYQWKQWHFQRIMTIGDASHKLHPISGNGGAAAIEDAAIFVNALQRKLDRSHCRLSSLDVQNIFAKTQRIQQPRTRHLLHHATKMQSFDAMESILAPLIVQFVIPNLTADAALAIVGENTTQGRRIESLPVPQRPRYVPYEDELPVKPFNASAVRFGIIIWYLVLFISSLASQTLPIHAISISRFDGLIHHYTQRITGWGGRELQPMSSLISLFPLFFIWNIEGYRRGNVGSFGAWPLPLLFSAALSITHHAGIIPLYLLLSTVNSGRVSYASVAGRPLPTSAVSAVRVAIYATYGILIISICLMSPYEVFEENFAALYRWLPLCVSILIRLLIIATKALNRHKELGLTKPYMEVYLNKDYKPLVVLYKTLFVLGFVAYMNVPTSNKRGMLYVTIVSHCLHSAFEIRRLGYAKSREVMVTMLAIIIASSIIGPGALYAGTWYWREKTIHRLSK